MLAARCFCISLNVLGAAPTEGEEGLLRVSAALEEVVACEANVPRSKYVPRKCQQTAAPRVAAR